MRGDTYPEGHIGRVKMASTVQRDPVGSISGFVIVFVSFSFRGFIPAPSWVWLIVLAVGVLLAVKGGVSGLIGRRSFRP